MQNPYRFSPMTGSTVICLGGVLMVLAGYFYFDDQPETSGQVTLLQLLAAAGYLLWIGGSILLARARFSSTKAGFICGLFLVPGLIALLCFVRTRTRQEIWQQANPNFSSRAQARQYRNVKSLY